MGVEHKIVTGYGFIAVNQNDFSHEKIAVKLAKKFKYNYDEEDFDGLENILIDIFEDTAISVCYDTYQSSKTDIFISFDCKLLAEFYNDLKYNDFEKKLSLDISKVTKSQKKILELLHQFFCDNKFEVTDIKPYFFNFSC